MHVKESYSKASEYGNFMVDLSFLIQVNPILTKIQQNYGFSTMVLYNSNLRKHKKSEQWDVPQLFVYVYISL